ncbi:MAG TPA: hypothetical protein V6C95_06235 [Coleofasciculaceae cyanobacterium]
MSRNQLKQYQSFVRQNMEPETISEVSRKVPGWFNRIFGWSSAFHAQDKHGRTWRIEYDGTCYCEDSGETR